MCARACACMSTRQHENAYTNACLHAHVHACQHVSMPTRQHANAYTNACVHVHVHACQHVSMKTHTQTHVCTRMCMRVSTLACQHVSMQTHTQTHVCTRMCMHVSTLACHTSQLIWQLNMQVQRREGHGSRAMARAPPWIEGSAHHGLVVALQAGGRHLD